MTILKAINWSIHNLYLGACLWYNHGYNHDTFIQKPVFFTEFAIYLAEICRLSKLKENHKLLSKCEWVDVIFIKFKKAQILLSYEYETYTPKEE